MGAKPRAIAVARLHGGSRATIRAACPCDAGRVQDYIRGLSLSSRYDRFLAPINELSPAELARIGGGNDRQATLIAEAKVAGARIVIGEARYAVDGSTCEIALSVADGWRGRGLGMLLVEYLECRARSLGLTRLVGDVLRSNTAMRTLARKAGFDQSGVPMDARLVGIVKDISAARVATPCGRSMAARLSLAA